jgi:hypothetical protein
MPATLTVPPRDVYGGLPVGDYVAIHADAAIPFAVRLPFHAAVDESAHGAPTVHWSLLTDAERDLVWQSRSRIVAGRF